MDNLASSEEQNKSSEPARSFVTLDLPCKYRFLRMVRQAVTDLCARAGMSELKAASLEMAVDEACSNVMEHSYGGETDTRKEPQHPGLRINLIQQDGKVLVEIFDRGRGFDFNDHIIMEPEQYMRDGHERGLGMYIIRKFVDDVAYERNTPYGHCLRMTKRL
ncbi:MAG: ATP-binding protein [Kiritimatiellia bacterium]